MFMLGALSQQSVVSLLPGLVSYWTLDEASGVRYDSHGSNDFTDDTAVGSNTGLISTAADFTSDFMSSPTSPGFNAGANDWSLFIWVYLDAVTGTRWYAMYGQAGGTGVANYNWVVSNHSGSGGSFQLLVANGSTWRQAIDTYVGVPSLSTWYGVYAQYNSATNYAGISINDNPLVEVDCVGTPNNVTSPKYRLGAQRTSFYYHDGRIDENGVWNRLLTPAERTFLFNSNAGRTYGDL